MNHRLKLSISYSTTFLKQLKKAPLSVKETFKDRLSLFLQDPFHPFLHNHKLAGKLMRYRSINITGDWRALFRESYQKKSHGKEIIFVLFGTHSQLYK